MARLVSEAAGRLGATGWEGAGWELGGGGEGGAAWKAPVGNALTQAVRECWISWCGSLRTSHTCPVLSPPPSPPPRGHASEKPELPKALEETPTAIRFLGPGAAAMAALGDKIGSTILAQSAGVPTLPWSGDGVTVDYAGERGLTEGWADGPALGRDGLGESGEGSRSVFGRCAHGRAHDSVCAAVARRRPPFCLHACPDAS